jgi:hypothetical protein
MSSAVKYNESMLMMMNKILFISTAFYWLVFLTPLQAASSSDSALYHDAKTISAKISTPFITRTFEKQPVGPGYPFYVNYPKECDSPSSPYAPFIRVYPSHIDLEGGDNLNFGTNISLGDFQWIISAFGSPISLYVNIVVGCQPKNKGT